MFHVKRASQLATEREHEGVPGGRSRVRRVPRETSERGGAAPQLLPTRKGRVGSGLHRHDGEPSGALHVPGDRSGRQKGNGQRLPPIDRLILRRHDAATARPDQRHQLLHGLSRVRQQASDGGIEGPSVGHVVSQRIPPGMEDRDAVGRADGPYGPPHVVETTIRRIHEHELGPRKQQGQQHPRQACARADIDDPARKVLCIGRKRRTHGSGEPGRVFDERLDGRRSEDAGSTSRAPGLLEGGLQIITQHPRRGR